MGEFKMRRAFVLPILLTLAGCAGAWSRPGGTDSDLAKDQAICEFEAKKATGNNSDAIAAGWNEGQLITACLKTKGWQR